MSIKREPYRYAPGEMTVLDGLTAADLDWVAVSWDLVHSDEGMDRGKIIQFLVVPGLYLFRMSTAEDTMWDLDIGWEYLDYDIRKTPQEGSTMLETAITSSTNCLELGYRMEQEPFVCDFTDFRDEIREMVHEEFDPADPPPLTLGDVFMYSENDELPSMIFNHVTATRSTLRKEA